jgi:general secretion pathway protein K
VRNRRGVALLLALWVLAILSFVGMEVGAFARADTGAARHLSERAQTYWAARGAVERGMALVSEYYRIYPASPLMAKLLGRGRIAGDEESRPPLPVWLEARSIERVPLGQALGSVTVTDLSGRLNVNRSDPDLLENLIANVTRDRSRAEELADAILDWVDADDLHRGRGAERDWYERRGLPLPRNSPVLQLRELLLVRGVTHELLFGERGRPGLAGFLTTEGTGKINVNSAAPEVLLAIPGMDEGTVARIVAERRLRHLRSLEEVLGPRAADRLSGNPLLGILSFEATEMRIEGVGEVPSSGTRTAVRAVIGVLPSGLVVRSWLEESPGGAPLTPSAVLDVSGAS